MALGACPSDDAPAEGFPLKSDNRLATQHFPLPSKVVRPGGPIRRASCDLFECLEAYERLPEETSRFVFKQLAETVCHLHRSGIIHCDLKVSISCERSACSRIYFILYSTRKDENIVIDAEFRVKLIDFGSAQLLDPTRPAPYHQKFRGVSFLTQCSASTANQS